MYTRISPITDNIGIMISCLIVSYDNYREYCCEDNNCPSTTSILQVVKCYEYDHLYQLHNKASHSNHNISLNSIVRVIDNHHKYELYTYQRSYM